MRRIAIATALLLLHPAPPGAAQPAPAPAASATAGARLSVAFLTAAFLAEAGARAEAARIEEERTTGAYFEEASGLIWTRADNGKDVDWFQAAAYCRDLELGDWSDWRVPTLEELAGLHDRRSTAEYKVPAGFRLTACCPWSSTRNGESSAWNFSFRHRQRFSGSVNYSLQLRALCVRTASAEEIEFYRLVAEEARKTAKRSRKRS